MTKARDLAGFSTGSITNTTADGLILKGDGSSTDVVIKNGADATVATVSDGSTNLSVAGSVTGALARGAIQVGNSSGVAAALAKGTSGHVLTAGANDLSWAAVAGVPAGAVIYHAANTAPTGFLKANGAAVSRSTYAALFTAIGTTFGSGDGSSTFNVPDLRGEFPRGWDDSRGIDSGRSFGSAQADQLEQHRHDTPVIASNTFSTFPSAGYSTGSYETVMNSREGDETVRYSGYTGGTDNSSENRPRNIALLACIKY